MPGVISAICSGSARFEWEVTQHDTFLHRSDETVIAPLTPPPLPRHSHLSLVPMLWFAVHTRSRAEAVVFGQLQRKSIESFLPTITRWSRWKDRKKAIDWPLFPGYCFARFEPGGQLAVLTCTGVVTIVSFAGELAPIPDDEIDNLRRVVESELKYDPAPLIKEGMQVRVTHGPLTGVIGRLVRKGGHARLFLSVDLLGQGVSVELDAADVQPL